MIRYLILRERRTLTVLLLALVFAHAAGAQTVEPKATGKAPVVIIPGLLGSELVNKTTGERVWFDLRRSKRDDLRLPVSTNLATSRDNLVAGDIIRSVQLFKFFPRTDIYEGLIKSLQAEGYTEGKWDAPAENGFEDTFYVFAYDWRRDNVENARLLVQKMESLKKQFRRPDLKFHLIGHSMGGLIARYAAMYGGAELPGGTQRPRPSWRGASVIGKVFLLGSPNEGSVNALNAAINGFAIFGNPKLNLPFFQNLTRSDVFAIPTIFQLLPHPGTLRALDENLAPMEVDVYDPLVWEKYGWTVYSDKSFIKRFTAAEQKSAKAYFRTALRRGKRFQEALNAEFAAKSPVQFYFIGSECKPTLDAMVIYRDGRKNRWVTLFKADSFVRSDGTKVSEKELETLLFAPGDGVVTRRSFFIETGSAAPKANLWQSEATIVCEEHGKLAVNADIQKSIFAALAGN